MSNILTEQQHSGSYLRLCENPVRFDPVTAVNNVFFDEANVQIFAVRSGGATGVIVKGPDDKTAYSFRLNEKGPLISIKFSYHHKILALQRSEVSVEFANFEDGCIDPNAYTLSCRGKNNEILTFHWITTNEIVLVTKQGIEFYQVNTERRQAKLIKNYSFSIHWSIFSPESSVLLCSTSASGNVISPFHFKNSQVWKLPKIEVDRGAVTNESGLKLFEKDVTLVNLYGNLFIAILRHPSATHQETGTEVNLYLLSRESPAKRMYSLILGMTGRFALSVIDNLVVVHHQTSKEDSSFDIQDCAENCYRIMKNTCWYQYWLYLAAFVFLYKVEKTSQFRSSLKTSVLFDIRLPGETSGTVTFLKPIVQPMPIKAYKLPVSGFALTTPDLTSSNVECELYSPTWIVFQPNIIIDAALGCMWFLQMKLDALPPLIKNEHLMFEFLLLRRGSKAVILKVLKRFLLSLDNSSSLGDIAVIFDKLNSVYKTFTEAEQVYLQARKNDANSSSSLVNTYPAHRLQVVVDQSDMFTYVLSTLAKQTNIDQTLICEVIIEYIRSLNDHKLPIQSYFYELIINLMVSSGKFHQLSELFQYNLIADFQKIAGYLLSLQPYYEPAYQLALDMYKRLDGSGDEIIDILLSKHKVLAALRFVKANSMKNTVSARKFLESAYESNDDMLFFDTYKFFENRNIQLRGKKEFSAGELCDDYVKHFRNKFGAFE